ncbi:MAG: PfkB family carbohydrate kinase [Thermoleophilia bacterium]|nr:PfkB family carbohydrate kinase [Thermoleophilia bacterium]
MRVAVVGHVEWIRFARVDQVPAAGAIAHSFENWDQVGGAGAVAAIQLAQLAGEATLFTALGDDDLGHASATELEERGVRVHACYERVPTRWALTHLDDNGERTITTVGPKLRPRGNDDSLPWHELAHMDAVVFVAGDVDALLRARRARVVTATARELDVLRRGAVVLDALVGSGEDVHEHFRPGDLDPPPSLVVTTSGALGGWAQPGGPFSASPPPGPIEDTYGAGDCFLAGLTYALAAGLDATDAVGFAARCGAAALTGRGVSPQPVDLR